jgi:hypothetical protein
MNTTAPEKLTPTAADHYPEEMLVRDARDAYFAKYGLDDGGYDDDWVFFWFGWIPAVLPNTRGRKRAIRAHDMHHIATGCNAVYDEGELDVVAFELRAGGPGWFAMGWQILLSLFALGLVLRPRQLWRLFLRARGARNLFGATVDESIYGLTVGELRARMRLGPERTEWDRRDVLEFLGWSLLSWLYVAALLAAIAGLLCLGASLL